MRSFFVTVRASNLAEFPGAEVVHTMAPAEVIATYCCSSSRKIGDLPETLILRVQAESRSVLERNKAVRRVRANVPEGGWASLDGNRYVQNC